MTLAEREHDRIVIQTEYRDKDLIRSVPGARYDVQRHSWTAPLTWASCIVLRGTFRERLEIGPELAAWATDHRDRVIAPALELRTKTETDSADMTEHFGFLRPFQRAGVEFLRHTKRALLTDEMGTGKTAQTISTVAAHIRNYEDAFPAFVVAPNSLKETWRNEFGKWWTAPRVEILEGGRAQRLKIIDKMRAGEAEVLVMNWEGIRGHSRLAPYGSIRLRRCHVCDRSLRDDPDGNPQSKCEKCPRELNEIDWKTGIADEIHRAKDPHSKQTRALWALATDETEIRLGLTGTPIADTPQDMWSALHFIDPLSFPTRGTYIDRYCLQSFNPFGGMNIIGLKPETRDEFFAITDPVIRRMPKALVLQQLPPKVFSHRYVDMVPKQAKAYKSMESDMMSLLRDDDQPLVAANQLTQLTRLTQFASAFAEIDDNGDVRLSEPSCKVDAMMELLEELGTKPLVVFAQQRQLIQLAAARLEKHGIRHGLIVGGQTGPERQAQIDQFMGGKTQVILGTIQAGGVGLTLTRADTLCRLQRSWSQIDNKQAEDRIHRIGAEGHNSVEIVDFIARGTIEEGQLRALEAKSERAEEVIRDKELLIRMLGDTK